MLRKCKNIHTQSTPVPTIGETLSSHRLSGKISQYGTYCTLYGRRLLAAIAISSKEACRHADWLIYHA